MNENDMGVRSVGKKDGHYWRICQEAGKHGLPDGFRLTGDGDMDGARDMRAAVASVPHGAEISPLKQALTGARGEGAKAMVLALETYFSTERDVRAECAALIQWIVSHAEGAPSYDDCLLVASRLLRKSAVSGAILAALRMLAVSEPRDPGELKKVVRTLALSGLYTDAAMAAAEGWNDYVDTLVWLSARADCVGRVAVANRLSACAPRREARDFMFYRACVHNPMAVFCAGACAEGGGLMDRLQAEELPKRDFKAASHIMLALFDTAQPEAYAMAAARVKDLDGVTAAYLSHAARQSPLSLVACRTVSRVSAYYEGFVKDVAGWGEQAGESAARCAHAAQELMRMPSFLCAVRDAACSDRLAEMLTGQRMLRDMGMVTPETEEAAFAAISRAPLDACELIEFLPKEGVQLRTLADIYRAQMPAGVDALDDSSVRALDCLLPAFVRHTDWVEDLLNRALSDERARSGALRMLHARLSAGEPCLERFSPSLFRRLMIETLSDAREDAAAYLARDATIAAREGVRALLCLPGMDETFGLDERLSDLIPVMLAQCAQAPGYALRVSFREAFDGVEEMSVWMDEGGALMGEARFSGDDGRRLRGAFGDAPQAAAALRGLLCRSVPPRLTGWTRVDDMPQG